jgi:hypothetical protein
MTNKYKYDVDALNDNFHFFGTSIGEWYANSDFDVVKKRMESGGLSFSIYYVPLPQSAAYPISRYAPQVDGARYLGHWVPVQPTKKGS